jgi:hypothetical protein
MLQSCRGHAISVGMETAAETASTVGPKSPFDRKGCKPSTRSSIANGRLLPMTDGRSATARRFKDLVYDISGDLGGMSQLTTAEVQLVRRASMLSAECERHEALAAQGDKEFDVQTYVVMTNSLKRVLEVIGVKRRSRDVTPDLSTYLQAKAHQP